MRIVVVSTGFNVRHKLCEGSVRSQIGLPCEVEHRFVDAAEQTPSRSCAENLVRMISDLPDDTIVPWIDYDDWLAHPSALATAIEYHLRGAWVTYGSFRFAGDPRCVPLGTYGRDWNVRGEDWRASHLKTFRAGLFNRIRKDDLFYRGDWITRAVDQAIMLAVLEMAGPERTVSISEALLEYNYEASFEANASDEELRFEQECVRHVRTRPRYPRLEALE